MSPLFLNHRNHQLSVVVKSYVVCYLLMLSRSFKTEGVGLTMTISPIHFKLKWVTTVEFSIAIASWRDLNYVKFDVTGGSIY